jgi:hypothetical protein
MIIFRSEFARGDWKIRLALVCLAVGFLGFFICWIVLWTSESRILRHHEFDAPTHERASAIQMKGRTFYVEPGYARRYRTTDGLISYIWAIGAFGMIYVKWREKKEKPK